jgi:hypothetical protein
MTTGRGMARAQGFPDLGIASFEHGAGMLTARTSADAMAETVSLVASKVEDILLAPEAQRRLAEAPRLPSE